MKLKRIFSIIVFIVAFIIFTNIFSKPDKSTDKNYQPHANNSYDTLSVPTWLGKVKGNWILVDCYHDQIIYSRDLSAPLTDWMVMTNDINKGHTVASDGTYYLADDTENNRVLVFKFERNGFVNTQTFEDIGNRPHYILYNESNKTFYCWSSLTGEMYLFKRRAYQDEIFISEIKSVPSLSNVYVRSFTIIGDEIYFVSGNENSKILVCDLETFTVKREYPICPELSGMVQLTPVGDYYYITVSTDKSGNQDFATIVRCKDLAALSDSSHKSDKDKANSASEPTYEDVYHSFVGGGTPYCIYGVDDSYYLLEHRLLEHSIWKFDVDSDNIVNVETIH